MLTWIRARDEKKQDKGGGILCSGGKWGEVLMQHIRGDSHKAGTDKNIF